jgi:hypothetical protein
MNTPDVNMTESTTLFQDGVRKTIEAREDLEERREKIIKQQAKLEKNNESMTSIENKILQSECRRSGSIISR